MTDAHEWRGRLLTGVTSPAHPGQAVLLTQLTRSAATVSPPASRPPARPLRDGTHEELGEDDADEG
ncbi:hypothetical protein [Streptomyces zhihengii]|uniref:hypothetical protein n=1 Tax=Streptomyces zhihengii TaxID=1818004 RepID=UPI0033AEE44B